MELLFWIFPGITWKVLTMMNKKMMNSSIRLQGSYFTRISSDSKLYVTSSSAAPTGAGQTESTNERSRKRNLSS